MIKEFDRYTANYYDDPFILDCKCEWDNPRFLISESEYLWRRFTSGGYQVTVPPTGVSEEEFSRHVNRVRMLIGTNGGE